MASSSSPASATTSDEPKIKVGIIGGGIAGLSCAAHLSALSPNIEPTVFDTGRLRPGGRCSSRLPGDKSKDKRANQNTPLSKFVVDHAAQILTIPSSDDDDEWAEFEQQVSAWEKSGVLRRFPTDSVVELRDKGGEKGEDITIRSMNHEQNKSSMYFGAQGMGSIPAAIASGGDFKIEQDVWISPSNGVKFIGSTDSPLWTIQTNGKRFGNFDRIVIAHNGKCADRLMSRTPAKSLHSLLRTNFAAYAPAWGGKKMTLNSIYSLTFVIKKENSPIGQILGENVYSAFLKNEPTLRFLTCQSRKYNESENSNLECWTLLSSPKFAKKFKGPQENLPKERIEEVTNHMITALEKSLNLTSGTIRSDTLMDSRLQLWGAAVPLNTWNNGEGDDVTSEYTSSEKGFIYDSEHGVGVCGDWLLDPSIGGAWESGRRLSNFIAKPREASESIGLPPNGTFRLSKASKETSIGNVR